MLDDDQLGQLVKSLFAQALAGDTSAAKLLLERVVPALRSTAKPVQIETSGTLSQQARDIVKAATDGHIAPDVAADLVRAIGSVVSIEEGDELRRRLLELEHGDLA